MEDFNYYTENDVELADIARCVEAAGYKTQTYFLVGEHLNILFSTVSEKGSVEIHCRWSKVLNDISDLEVEEQNRIKRLNFHLKSFLSVEYMRPTLPDLVSILRVIMKCYGGYVRIESVFYNADNISDLLENPV